MNSAPESQSLKLNISEADNAMNLELARSVAPYFRVSTNAANEIIERSQGAVKLWPQIANSLRIPTREQAYMASAF